jgi:hypothetical protein
MVALDKSGEVQKIQSASIKEATPFAGIILIR